MSKRAVVLLSGGVDSSTTAAIAKAEGYEIYALSFDYAQRHRVELESARRVAESLGVKKQLIIKFDLREIGGSALTSDIDVPKNRIRNSEAGSRDTEKSEIPITYVPARNTIFLSFGLSWAEVLEAPDIFIGANAIDYSGYPDCRPEYLKAFETMANLSTKVSTEGKVKFAIKAPLLYLTKSEIIKKGTELGLDYSLTWSCYDPQPIILPLVKGGWGDFVPCGRCDSCLIRAKGFKEAGLKDPLPA
ncbi:MAG: 7-cyano-7-deazaguanine synthase QueC [Nitrospirota bacterium]